MSDVTDALVAMQTLVRAIDPSPNPTPDDINVWVYPDENDRITFSRLPMVIISQFIFDVNRLESRGIGGGRYSHQWKMQIDVFLTKGNLTDNKIQATAEQLQDTWYTAFANEIMQRPNLSLTGVVDELGPGMEYVTGNIPWRDRFVGWGIRFIVPVRTTFCAS